MPPHETYIEAFVGSGAIFKNKRPAELSVLIDSDDAVIDAWRRSTRFSPERNVITVCGDARSTLRDWKYRGRTLVYADPPYPIATRRWKLPLYRHELATMREHAELLRVLKSLPCAVMISGYRCQLYDRELAKWQRVDYLAPIHRPPHFTTESVWMNYPLEALHDWRYLGQNFRERERIKRKQTRWRRRLSTMPAMERAAMLEILLELASPEKSRGSTKPRNGHSRPEISSPGSHQGDDRPPGPHSAIRFFSRHPPPKNPAHK